VKTYFTAGAQRTQRQKEKGIETAKLVTEAIGAAGGPLALGPLRHHFFYDLRFREWCFDGCYSEDLGPLGKEWVPKIRQWLQEKYPEGPAASVMESPAAHREIKDPAWRLKKNCSKRGLVSRARIGRSGRTPRPGPIQKATAKTFA
jgi:hypothetical protein